ncbi:hypothetical protein D9613_004435 [Agrocybe pediades]|uniref:Nephrocystin 3-like N-terminal domain-containing protein n=1 Tax=Agrocybe pediades TaxID=84607 RepID=A0A8H4VI55_9AGAR|nr:hypothetical protein D9613_004435 [Agrocybe pediades]
MSQAGTQIPPLINLNHSILSGGTFTQQIDQRQYTTVRNGELSGYERLLDNVAPAALHDSGHVVDPPKCHPDTRVTIIQTVIDWASGATLDEEVNQKSILWLKGGAGAGKSAIARSVAERCSKEGLLLGTFFFGAADTTRNHVGSLVATLAYQVGRILPELREMVASLIEDDPLVFSRSISTQFTTLLVRPLSIIFANHSGSTQIPRLVIIDGLDECRANVDSQRDLLFTLQGVITSTTLIRFLVCSRPESHLSSAFSSPRMANIHYKIFLDDDYSAKKDIQLYLEDKFREIKEGHIFKHTLPATWPSPEMITHLVNKSSGQFIYASTVIKYVESPRHRPHQRLDAVFNLRPAFKDLPFTALDALYRHIFSKAEDLPIVLDILAFPTLYGPFHRQAIEVMLHLEEGDVEVMLADLCSVVNPYFIMYGPPGIGVGFVHKSLTDFLSDPQRAGDLYRDLSAVRLRHIARSIEFFSSEPPHWSDIPYAVVLPLTLLRMDSNFSTASRADYFSFDILQAAQQFPIFEFAKGPLLTKLTCRSEKSKRGVDLQFLRYYLSYLNSIKEVCESAMLVYMEQMRQYCECVLFALENHFSNDWEAHFIYSYYHLQFLTRPDCPASSGRSSSIINLTCCGMDIGTFGTAVIFMAGEESSLPFSRNLINIRNSLSYFREISQISYDLTKGLKQEAIFSKSACFCLAFLCNEKSTSQDARRISRIMKIDERQRRVGHPWRWRRMRVLRRSIGDHGRAIVLTCARKRWPLVRRRYAFTILRKAHFGEALWSVVAGRRAEDILHGIFTIREYFSGKFRDRIKPEQRWPLYIILMDLIPHILPLSGRYEPLVTMCREKCFASISQFWPKESRRARQAIETYLQRMDSEDYE